MISRSFRIAAPSLVSMVLIAGCGPSTPAAVAIADPVEVRTSIDDPSKPAPSVVPLAIAGFAESTIADEIPEGQSPPDDRTMSGRSTASIRQQVERIWGRIPLSRPDAKPIPYILRIDSAEGPIEIALLTATAPKHSRHAIALAKSGYFDGLSFDRIVRQEARTPTGLSRLEVLRGGCPRGTGEEGIGHIGYWLEPEIDPGLKHEAGTVGFWHDADSQASGCRFYITLGPAPIMDGHFTIVGKVISGLDTLRTIANKPTVDPENDPERPRFPTAIRTVTVSPDPFPTEAK